MLERTQTAMNLLDVMQELELLDVSFLNADEWIKCTDRKTLYRAAITALVENAQADGFKVTIHCESDAGDPVMYVDVDDAPETECDQLGGGCTCESCTAQITDAIGGIPIDLDTHEFTDDCERIN